MSARPARQVGLARVVTDHATFAYLCDVYVLEEHRGHGLGKRLIEAVMAHPALTGARRAMLGTRDAHGLYARHGFRAPPANGVLMEILRPDMYRDRRRLTPNRSAAPTPYTAAHEFLLAAEGRDLRVRGLPHACGLRHPARRETPLTEVVPITAPVLAAGVEANSDKLFVVVTFSGGGKRAAAFSYGVLEALRDVKVTTPDGEQRALLDEIDIISAVSGGAFTAAYYALNGQETFDSYAPRFLNHDTEKDLWRKVLDARRTGRASPTTS